MKALKTIRLRGGEEGALIRFVDFGCVGHQGDLSVLVFLKCWDLIAYLPLSQDLLAKDV